MTDPAVVQFLDDLYRMNEVMNLTRVPREEAEVRHILDSTLISDLIAPRSRVLDLGCGPGFPAWPLAQHRPDIHVTAVDGSAKPLSVMKSNPLENLDVFQGRAEDLNAREHYDVVTGRALAPFITQIEVSAAWVAIGGRFIPFRTPAEREEIEAFNSRQLGLELVDIVEMPLTDKITRLFPVFQKVAETPREFPRPWGRMKLRPLGTARPGGASDL